MPDGFDSYNLKVNLAKPAVSYCLQGLAGIGALKAALFPISLLLKQIGFSLLCSGLLLRYHVLQIRISYDDVCEVSVGGKMQIKQYGTRMTKIKGTYLFSQGRHVQI